MLSGHGLVNSKTGLFEPPVSAYLISSPSIVWSCGAIGVVCLLGSVRGLHEAIPLEGGRLLRDQLPVDVRQSGRVVKRAGLDRTAHGDDADVNGGARQLPLQTECEVELRTLPDTQRGRHRCRRSRQVVHGE